jgi:hypothetical protein
MARLEALASTVLRIAEELGVSQLEGVSPAQFYELKTAELIEESIPDLADTVPSLAASVKLIHEKIKNKHK